MCTSNLRPESRPQRSSSAACISSSDGEKGTDTYRPRIRYEELFPPPHGIQENEIHVDGGQLPDTPRAERLELQSPYDTAKAERQQPHEASAARADPPLAAGHQQAAHQQAAAPGVRADAGAEDAGEGVGGGRPDQQPQASEGRLCARRDGQHHPFAGAARVLSGSGPQEHLCQDGTRPDDCGVDLRGRKALPAVGLQREVRRAAKPTFGYRSCEEEGQREGEE